MKTHEAEVQIRARVRAVIQESLQVDAKQLTPDARLIHDLGATSLDVLELELAVEDEFGIALTNADFEGVLYVGEVEDLVLRRVREPSQCI